MSRLLSICDRSANAGEEPGCGDDALVVTFDGHLALFPLA
jgi:hypothetical protein